MAPLLALVVAAAVLIPLALSGDEHKTSGAPANGPVSTGVPSTSSSAAPAPVSWQVARDNDFGTAVQNSYVDGGQVVVAWKETVAAFDQKTGSLNWKLSAPALAEYPGAHGGSFCGASSRITNGILAVTIGRDLKCAVVAAIDVKTGRFLWTTQMIPPSGVSYAVPDSVPVEIVGTDVVVGLSDQIAAFSLDDGSYQKWRILQNRKDPRYRNPDDCPVSDLLAAGDDSHVYFTDQCVLSNTILYGAVNIKKRTDVARQVEPSNLPFKSEDAELVSVNPLIVLIHDKSRRSGEYRVLDSSFRVVARVPCGSGATGLDTGNVNLGGPFGIAHKRWRPIADDKTMVTVTRLARGKANKLVGIDVRTGKQRWRVPIADAKIYGPIAFEGTDVLVAAGTHAGKGTFEVVRVDTTNGKVKSTQPAPWPDFTGRQDLGVAMQFGWSDGQVYGVLSAFANLGGVFEGPTAFTFREPPV